LSTLYNWNDTTSQWVFSGKTEEVFDSNGNLILSDWSQWNLTTGQWVDGQKIEVSYDVNGYCTFQSYNQWDVSTGLMISGWNTTNYYSEFTFIPGIPENRINVYPNPASEYIVFFVTDISDKATIELFDNQGKKVLDQKLAFTGQISISHLAKGIYLYRIQNSGKIYKGKIIINNNFKH
jgi:hypothetical protein